MSNLVIYLWNSNSENGFLRALDELQISYVTFARPMSDYHMDGNFAEAMIPFLHEQKAGAVFSFDYFPLLASICNVVGIPYISWVYDRPHYTLLSNTITLPTNRIFCFDAEQCQELAERGANAFHLPLGVDLEMLQRANESSVGRMTKEAGDRKENGTQAEVSFVGNFYNGSTNYYRQDCEKYSSFQKGYLDGVIEAQRIIYGYNLVPGAISEAFVQELPITQTLPDGDLYSSSKRIFVENLIQVEVTARERERILAIAGSAAEVNVYTGGELPRGLQENPRIHNCGYADYEKNMPIIFHNSKINLNITLKSITSGIPQRVLDILACGGFCLTNYQPEIGELFADGEELVMYTSEEDFQQKLEYYLTHDEERQQIAASGLKAVMERFDLRDRVGILLEAMEQ